MIALGDQAHAEARDEARAPRRGIGATFVKHQAASIFTTAVDFGTMIACVHFAAIAPVWATGIGAGVGAVTNFTLGRRWIFRNREGHAGHQALRYAFVSGASLLLNMIGEWLVHDVAQVQYVFARAMVAALVSVLWNFPMQRGFVFKKVFKKVPEKKTA